MYKNLSIATNRTENTETSDDETIMPARNTKKKSNQMKIEWVKRKETNVNEIREMDAKKEEEKNKKLVINNTKCIQQLFHSKKTFI